MSSQVKVFMHHTGPDAADNDPEQVKKFKEYLKSMIRLKFNADKVVFTFTLFTPYIESEHIVKGGK